MSFELGNNDSSTDDEGDALVVRDTPSDYELPCYAEAQTKLMMITSLYERPLVQERHRQRTWLNVESFERSFVLEYLNRILHSCLYHDVSQETNALGNEFLYYVILDYVLSNRILGLVCLNILIWFYARVNITVVSSEEINTFEYHPHDHTQPKHRKATRYKHQHELQA
ncbi:hypothetical protein GOP47_0005489 [Adiantum capillus-veneris]|uniref:Uncharacterized protein n=1 Tax=Adiantum capillus-veneris TaxID=13818 RepID=A0A9D4V565_ADICA|nr:hypothetical protein GOP47_0005489 [Adiantum capillus-veneris]